MKKEMERIMWLHGAYFQTLHNHKGKKLTSKLIDIIDEEAVESYSKHTKTKKYCYEEQKLKQINKEK